MQIREARKVAIKTAADWVAGSDWDQFWGEELTNACWADDKLAAVLTQAKREIAERIRKLDTTVR